MLSMLESSFLAFADRCALRGSDGATLSYAQLAAASDQFAETLRRHHRIGVGDLVGLYVNRSIDMVVAMIGIMKAGAGFVPIDPVYPKERIHYMLSQSQAPLVITEASLMPQLEGGGLETALLSDLRAKVLDGRREKIAKETLAESAAYVIFTSGTTGEPKGVAVPHRAVAAFLEGMIDRPGLALGDRLLTNASISFDMTIYELFLPLAVGAEAVVTSRDVAGDGDRLVSALHAFDITSMIATPATWRLILASGWEGKRGFKAVCGGEAFPRDLASALLQRCGSVWNIYGPTETTVICLVEEVKPGTEQVLLGFPTRDTKLFVTDHTGALAAPGSIGELLIGGPQVSLGYLNAPHLNAAKFIPNTLESSAAAPTLYRSGDLVRRRADGNLEYHGRMDHQVKIRGYRIELGEIHQNLAQWHQIQFCHVAVKEATPGDKRIIAYIILKQGAARLDVSGLRTALGQRLPDYMLPHHFMVMSAFPMTANGKIDQAALPEGSSLREELGEAFHAPSTPLEAKLAAVFAGVLRFDQVGIHDDLFQLGLNSLLATTAVAELQRRGVSVSVAQVYASLTIAKLGEALSEAVPEGATTQRSSRAPAAELAHDVAIIGMAGRFPGAEDIERFWQLLVSGSDAIMHFSRDELSPRLPEALKDDPSYVPARGVVSGAQAFDAKFFGVPPIEAAMIDPQQRLFLEECWHALEDGGQVPRRFDGTIGVYAGMHRSSYFSEMLRTNPEAIERYGDFNTMIATEKDYIATRVAHRLDLRGPAVSVHTACSTSAVAIAEAVVALRALRCDMALAGGASITIPQHSGHLYAEGGIQSKDGRCRPFASDASGTVFSDGVGVVLLKRLADAERDGDHIYAVIRGVAVNNDGKSKSSFMAPSVAGQRACIEAALGDAHLHPHALSHVEAHGTGTAIGDPIETSALRQALTVGGVVADVKIGSIKSNFGHMVAAAGVASVIKTALALSKATLPASLHAATVNPECGFDARFRVNTELGPWQAPQGLFAGVSSFGVGGTNAHLVLAGYEPKGAPAGVEGAGEAFHQLAPISAKTKPAVDAALARVSRVLCELPPVKRAQAAWTLQDGREAWNERAFLIASPRSGGADEVISFKSPIATAPEKSPATVWMFPGQGTQYWGMARALYRAERLFRAALDCYLDHLETRHGLGLRPALLGSDDAAQHELLGDTRYTQPAILIVSLALADLWRGLGLRADAVIGHSIGEFAAAVTAGIMTAKTAIDLVVIRANASAEQPRGSMLAVRLPAAELTLPDGVALASVNSPSQTVLSGPTELIQALGAQLSAQGVTSTLLDTSHAFHSAMMQPVATALEKALASHTLEAPRLPFYSTVTGSQLDDSTARSSAYWAGQAVAPVLFAAAATAASQAFRHYLEVGPRAVLLSLLKQNKLDCVATPSQSPSGNPALDHQSFLKSVGLLWQVGHAVDWRALGRSQRLTKIPMPGYVFERARHWVLSSDV